MCIRDRGHGQSGDCVFRLQDQLRLEVIPAEILVDDISGPVPPLDEDKGHLLERADIRSLRELAPDLLRLLPKQLVGKGLGHHHDQPLLCQRFGPHSIHHDRLEADDQVHPAVGQLVLQLGGVALKQGELHQGELCLLYTSRCV